MIKGNVPGPKNAIVVVKTAVKNPDKVNDKVDLVFYEVEKEEIAETKEEVVEETENDENETIEETPVETTKEPKEEEPAQE